jgi:alkanesulfonate monooxygenase SsuD/methylene tetrahydromethanopterin reductase-like flavin-dependent oxidoreductase (luciferase family)
MTPFYWLARLLGAAVSVRTAEWVGSWADGLITTGRARDEMRSITEAFDVLPQLRTRSAQSIARSG